jgi:hypothetical protein
LVQAPQALHLQRDPAPSLTKSEILKDTLTKIYTLMHEHAKDNHSPLDVKAQQSLPGRPDGGFHRRRCQSMKQYVIDQLQESDFHRLKEHLDKNLVSTLMEGIYWVDLPVHLYTDMQREHSACQPYYFAINLNLRQIAFEWLIRSRPMLHCPCMGYADPRQREFIIHYAESLLEELKIRA